MYIVICIFEDNETVLATIDCSKIQCCKTQAVNI